MHVLLANRYLGYVLGVPNEDIDVLVSQVSDILKECSNNTDISGYAGKMMDLAGGFLKVIENRRK